MSTEKYANSGTAARPGILAGKCGLVMGVANNRSIAWGIAKACYDAGAELAFTWQGEALEKRVRPLAEQIGALPAGHCDVTDGSTIDAVFDTIEEALGVASTSSSIASLSPTRTS